MFEIELRQLTCVELLDLASGIASAAVAQLLKLAVRHRSVQRVVAEILPSNIGSSKVVSRLGFTARESFVDTDGETVVRWIYPVC
ncbi:GNAT family N-acetyltransferase [Pseudoduganella sp. S-14]|uniref:GNAT family N-acetyltransferase n=1 Tax=Pseudoduganella sp. S-14 TaxID=3404065 RepID=UPI003CF6A764